MNTQTEPTPPTVQAEVDPIYLDYLQRLSTSKVPAHLQEGLALYIAYGWNPGSFLAAVLSSDIVTAVNRADDASRAALADIVQWLIWHAPFACWGNYENVSRWPGLVPRESQS